jgi:hypothetical protein
MSICADIGSSREQTHTAILIHGSQRSVFFGESEWFAIAIRDIIEGIEKSPEV